MANTVVAPNTNRHWPGTGFGVEFHQVTLDGTATTIAITAKFGFEIKFVICGYAYTLSADKKTATITGLPATASSLVDVALVTKGGA